MHSALRFLTPPWARSYQRSDGRADLAAGLTIGAMLVPQAMAYALLAGLPPEVGLYASTVPLLAYAVFGTSRQLAVGPVAIVSLMTAAALGPIVAEGSAGYLAAAAMLAVMVGVVHLVLGFGRLGHIVNLLSHAVLVGFTAAAAIIIGFSQAKHLLGISVPRHDHFYESVIEVGHGLGDTNGTTLALGLACLTTIFALKRWAPRVPSALVVVVGSIIAAEAFDLQSRGVSLVGDIPDSLPMFAVPDIDLGVAGQLITTALAITMVGFMESIAVAKVYARRHAYDVDPNRELIALGSANVASGLFGGYPVTGGFSRTAVNDTAGARTPLASVITAAIVLISIALLTPILASLPKAALGAIIIAAVIGLIDVAEMRHIAKVKPTDLVGLAVAFAATLGLGIELGILVAVVASMLVVFARLSFPHSAVLGHVDGTTSYRNIDRFPEARTRAGIGIVRVDSPVSFVNADVIKRRLLDQATDAEAPIEALVLDASGINDLDATGADMFAELERALAAEGVEFHLTDVKGPVRDVLRRGGLWDALAGRIHTCTHDALTAISHHRNAPSDQRRHGIDERCIDGAGAVTIDTDVQMTVHSEDPHNHEPGSAAINGASTPGGTT